MSEYRKQIETSAELAAWYDAKYMEMGDGWNTPVEECNRHLDDLGVVCDQTKRLLDVGCGAGHFLAEAAKRVTVLGIEISAEGIKHCARRAPTAFLEQGSIEDGVQSNAFVLFDYVVSLGSLEHIVDLPRALDNIRRVLDPTGKFYFYCPNELWKHFDQPNERNMADAEWVGLFAEHWLYVESTRRWNDNTAFIGRRGVSSPVVTELAPHGTKLNIGSGQRRFDTSQGWVNIDCVSRPPDQVPDWICDVGREPLPYADGSIEYVVLHQVYEHFGLGEGYSVIREANRVLRGSGSLIITVPCASALAKRRMLGQINDYIYAVNIMGAFMGLEGDRHKWLFWDLTSLQNDIAGAGCTWARIKAFDWRPITGADVARDWYILGLECVK